MVPTGFKQVSADDDDVCGVELCYHVSLLTILDRTTNCDQMSLSRASAPDSLSIFELLVTSPIIPSARIGLHVGGLHLAGHPVHSGEPRPSVVAGGRSS